MNIEIANRLVNLRKEHGYSQEDLADKLGLSRQAISKWERGESSPDTDNLIALSKLYNISIDELLNNNKSKDELKKTSELNIVATDDEGQKVEIKNNTVKFTNPDGSEKKLNKKDLALKSIINAVLVSVALIVFFLWGNAEGYHISWIVWLIYPTLGSIYECIAKKRFSEFAVYCLVTAIYCYIGFKYFVWHPTWLMFIIIPVYYAITNYIDIYVLKTKTEEKEK